jgi:sporulation protein YabP
LEENVNKIHNVIVEDRKKFTLTGIKEVCAFDEENIMLDTSYGKLSIKGSGLHILNFDSVVGDLLGEGRIHAFIYTAPETSGGLFSKIFR